MSSLLDCFYEYLRQPPTELDCNPYNGMRVECEVLAPVSVGVDVEIQWFYNDEQIMLDSFPVGTDITDEVDDNIRTSTLVFTSDLTDTYRGNYHCQIVVNGNFTAPSQSLSLVDEETYIILPTQFCPVQAVDTRKCAGSRATIAPPSPSTTTQPDTSSPTTDPPTPPPTTSGSEMISTDHNTVDATMEVESPTSVESDTMVWLIMLLVFVFGTVMIILIIGVLVCCLRKKLKNGTKGGI